MIGARWLCIKRIKVHANESIWKTNSMLLKSFHSRHTFTLNHSFKNTRWIKIILFWHRDIAQRNNFFVNFLDWIKVVNCIPRRSQLICSYLFIWVGIKGGVTWKKIKKKKNNRNLYNYFCSHFFQFKIKIGNYSSIY